MKKTILTTAIAFILGMGIQQNAHADLKDGLVAHWSFDDCRATDNSGNGHDGTLNGNPQCVDGVKGKAFSFDGSNDWLDGSINSDAFAGNWTIATWFYHKGNETPTVTWGGIFSNNNEASNAPVMSFRGGDDNNTGIADSNYFGIDGAGITAKGTFIDLGSHLNKWIFAVITYQNGIPTVYAYKDGQLIKNSQALPYVLQRGDKFYIARHYGGPNTVQLYKGSIDDLRIYNRALTEAEVLELYNGKTELTYTPEPDPTPIIGKMPDPKLEASGENGTCSVQASVYTAQKLEIGDNGSVSSSSAAEVCSNVAPVFDPTKLPKVVNMNNATCRYVAPFYEKIWNAMDVKTAPSCGDVLRYYTWQNSTRADNYAASTYFSNQLNGVEADNTLFNDRMEQVDKTVSTVLDSILLYDLGKKVFTVKDASVNVMKKAGILTSLSKGEAIFKSGTVYGDGLNKALEKTLLDTVVIEKGTGWLCGELIADSKVSKSCANESKKIATCAKLVVSKGAKAKLNSTAILKDAAECIIGGVTSTIGMAGNWYDVGKVVGIKQKIYGYILINDYLDNYYKKALKKSLNDNASLEKEVRALAEKGNLSYSWLDLDFDDYDVNFVVNGIQDSSLRNSITSSRNVQATESARKSFEKYKLSRDIVNGLVPNS